MECVRRSCWRHAKLKTNAQGLSNKKNVTLSTMMLLLAVAASHLSTVDEDHQKGRRRWIFRWLSSTRDSPKSHPQSSGADDVELTSFAVKRRAEWAVMVAPLEELCCKCSGSVSHKEGWDDETEKRSQWTMRPIRNAFLHFLDNWAVAYSNRISAVWWLSLDAGWITVLLLAARRVTQEEWRHDL